MHVLYLLRHAKSSWAEPALDDSDRPLAPRGRRDALRLADHMRAEGVAPELVLCSPARRTRQTLDAIAAALTSHVRIEFDEELYLADGRDLLRRLHRIPAGVGSVMLIGHNPGMQDLAADLAAAGPIADRLHAGFPTAALATLRVRAADWRQLRAGGAELTAFVTPAGLRGER